MGVQEALRRLYQVDQQLRGLESRLDGARRHVRTQTQKLDQLNLQRQALVSQLQHTKASAGNLENEARVADERISRLREQMNNAKTNKEFSALLLEVNTLKVDKGKLEEQALELLTKADDLSKQVADLDGTIEQHQKIRQMAEAELASRQAEVGDQLESLKRQRAEAAGQVPHRALEVFDRMAATFEGEAMAAVVEADRRRMEYTCGGCYMLVPIERVNQLATADDVVTCASCGRILYLELETRQSMGTSK